MKPSNPPLKSLEARYYTDATLFEKEKSHLFTKTWQFACHESEVAHAGAYYCFSLAGEDLFITRDNHGALHCYYNVCQHRAHQLLSGKGETRVITCPYHAWTYELTGQLRAAPNTRTMEHFNRVDICLTEVKVERFLGFLFVNLDADAQPMDAYFPNVRQEIEEWLPHFKTLKPLEWVEIPEKCNWKVSVENYSECYHCSLNHPTFSTGVVKPETYDIQPQGKCLRHTTECSNLENMTYDIYSGFEHFDEYSSWYLWPMFSFQIYPGNLLNTYHWRAIDVDNVVVWRGWYSMDGAENAVIRKLARQDRETTVEEDIKLVENVQRGLKSRGYVPGPLVIDPNCGVMSEHSIAALHSWMREAVE